MKKITIFLIVILFIGCGISIYKYNSYESYVPVQDYIQVKAKPCEYVLNGETRDFEIFYNEDEYGELTIDKLSVSGVVAKKELERKSRNHYTLTLCDIYPTSEPNQYNIGQHVGNQKFIRGYEAIIEISYKTNRNPEKQNRQYQFYVVNNYMYQEGNVHRNIFTGTLTFNLVYKGDNIITLTKQDMRLSGFSGNIKLRQNKKDKKKIEVKISNVNYNYENNNDYKIYMSGGTSITSYGELSNANTIIPDIDLELETTLDQILKNPLISAFMWCLTGISTFISMILDIKTLRKEKQKRCKE